MCTEVWCIMLRGRLFTEGEAANHTCHGSDRANVWVQRALGMPSKGHNAVEGCVEETCQVQSLEDDPVMALSERG